MCVFVQIPKQFIEHTEQSAVDSNSLSLVLYTSKHSHARDTPSRIFQNTQERAHVNTHTSTGFQVAPGCRSSNVMNMVKVVGLGGVPRSTMSSSGSGLRIPTSGQPPRIQAQRLVMPERTHRKTRKEGNRLDELLDYACVVREA
jgi:hypothetical protein